MSVVNVDSAELLEAWKNIKTAITSVEGTKYSMMRSYQQLGSDWKDKKYRELGDVVQDCTKALNIILSTLSKGEKFIGSLAKSLQEYEDVNLQSPTTATDASLLGFLVHSATNSFSSDVREWTGKLEELSRRIFQIYSDKYSEYISQDKLARPLSETVSYETQALFRSRGMEDGVLGYNDGVRSHIAVGTGHELQTTVHENLHQLSANGRNHGIVVVNGNARGNVQLNEAITELLTQRTLGSDYGPDYSAYSSNRDAMAILESFMGEETICRAYFQNQPELMQNLFDNALGQGSWEQLSEAFDDCVSEYQHTRTSGRIRRDDLINRYAQVVGNYGGAEEWTEILI